MNIDDFWNAFCEALMEAAEAMKQMAATYVPNDEDLREFLREFCYTRREKRIPPRRAIYRARSPFLRRYWIHYKARDHIARRRLKTEAKGGK